MELDKVFTLRWKGAKYGASLCLCFMDPFNLPLAGSQLPKDIEWKMGLGWSW